MVVSAVVGGVAAIGGAAIQSSAAGKAAKAQQRAAQASIAEQRAGLEYAKGVQDPYLQAGQQAIMPFRASLGIGTPDEIAAAQQMFQNSPDYQWTVNQGVKSAMAQANAGRMGKDGGGILRSLSDYTRGQAMTHLGNWRQAVGTLQDQGAATAARLGNQATGVAGNIGETLTTGAARASAYRQAGADAWAGGLQDTAKIFGSASKYDAARDKPWFG